MWCEKSAVSAKKNLQTHPRLVPRSNAAQLKTSIQQRIYCLDEAATVVPGHGPETSIGQEMRFNAFVRGNS